MRGPFSAVRAVVFDVDDVVIDTDRAGAVAERSVAEPLRAHLGDAHAEAVARSFVDTYAVLLGQLRAPAGVKTGDFARYEARLLRWERGVVEAGHEPKIWSREVIAAVALEDLGVPVTNELVRLATDHYWKVMAEATVLHEDAAELIPEIEARGIAVHLATNSDGFLRFDEAGATFVYDPPWAVARKIERLGLIETIGLGPRDVTVGDPIGKPKRAFFEKVLADLQAKVGRPVSPAHVIAIGDSLTNDVLPLLELGASAGIWLKRKSGGDTLAPDPDHDRVFITRDLRALRDHL